MPRMSLSEVLASAAAKFPDNTTGLITPAVLRQWVQDIVYAIRPAYGVISRTAPISQALTTVPAPIVMDAQYISDVPDYTCAPALGRITRTEAGVTRLNFTADVAGVAATRTITFTINENGTPTVWRQSLTTAGTGNTESLAFSAIIEGTGLTNFDIMASIDTNSAITFSNMAFVAETVPVWEY